MAATVQPISQLKNGLKVNPPNGQTFRQCTWWFVLPETKDDQKYRSSLSDGYQMRVQLYNQIFRRKTIGRLLTRGLGRRYVDKPCHMVINCKSIFFYFIVMLPKDQLQQKISINSLFSQLFLLSIHEFTDKTVMVAGMEIICLQVIHLLVPVFSYLKQRL